MSENHDAPLKQEEDRIPTVRIVFIGFLALLAFVVGISWAVRIQKGVTGSVKSKVIPKAAAVGQREIGMVYQPLFEKTDIANEHDAPLRAWLQTYGWVDPERKIAHIPIDRAMQLVVERGRL